MEQEKRLAKVENLWKDIGIRFKARINLKNHNNQEEITIDNYNNLVVM